MRGACLDANFLVDRIPNNSRDRQAHQQYMIDGLVMYSRNIKRLYV
jgi:hypothetical protein